jgi:hypothetical protein
MMRVVHVGTHDITGGGARSAFRLHTALACRLFCVRISNAVPAGPFTTESSFVSDHDTSPS